MARRPKSFFIVGLGDGDVHANHNNNNNNNNNNHNNKALGADDLFTRRNRERKNREGTFRGPSFTIDITPDADGISQTSARGRVVSSWQYSAMVALIVIMGFLVFLIFHLVTDNVPHQHKGRKISSNQRRKKKTDAWSDDYESESDVYGGDNEDTGCVIYDYPYTKEPQYPKHRKTSRPSHQQQSFYVPASELPTGLSPSYKSPSNSFTSNFYSTPSVHETSPTFVSPTKKTEISTVRVRPLSPVLSFPSLQDASDPQREEPKHLPLPPGVSRGSKTKHSSSLQVPMEGWETPRAGIKRGTIPLDIPQPPNLDTSSDFDITPKIQKPVMAFAPRSSETPRWKLSKPPPQSISVEELHSQMESGSLSSKPDIRCRLDRQPVLDLEKKTKPPESSNKSDRHRNIHHVRQDWQESTDTASSLLSSIKFDELQLEEIIGGGGFGQVWKATWRSCPVAVKVLTGSAQRENVSKLVLQEFSGEIEMLKGIRHPNICLYMGACLDPPNRAIVTELAVNGSVWDALRLPLQQPYAPSDGITRTGWPLALYGRGPSNPPLPPQGKWPWQLVHRVASGAARAMCFLHSGRPPVLHRDLKSANLLLDESYTTKVCDFGLSRLKAQERSMTGNCGTVQWMAPEILANQSYAEPADVYSFGIILWELLSAECPYDGMSAIQCAIAVLNKGHRPEIPAWCPLPLASLIESCLRREQLLRPSFSQIILALDAIKQ